MDVPRRLIFSAATPLASDCLAAVLTAKLTPGGADKQSEDSFEIFCHLSSILMQNSL